MTKRFKLQIAVTTVFLLLIFVLTANKTIEDSTDDRIYTEISKTPYNKVGLLLGTSKFLGSGLPNQYFFNRIDATMDLYNSQKIEFIVISGDHGKKTYNEPLDMKNELIKRGVPEQKIYLDYAGFRTFDSVIRMYKIFGQQSFTVISQDFHNRRAIYIAKRAGLNAIGYDAKDVSKYLGFKTKLREKFARVKVFLDLWLRAKPKYLGDPIEIK